MSVSLSTLFMQTMETELQAALVAQGFRQAVSSVVPTGVFMDRSEPVGNEKKLFGPVLLIYCDTIASSDEQCHTELVLTMPFQVDIHMYCEPNQRFRVIVDPVVQCVQRTVTEKATTIPGVTIASLRVIAYGDAPEGPSVCKMVYTILQSVKQLDLTSAP